MATTATHANRGDVEMSERNLNFAISAAMLTGISAVSGYVGHIQISVEHIIMLSALSAWLQSGGKE